MRLPLKAVSIAFSLLLPCIVSSQDLVRSLSTDSDARLNRVQSQDLDGLKLLVLCANPDVSVAKQGILVWNALEAKGVEVTFVRERLTQYKLNRFDQLWIFSSNQYDARVLTKHDFQSINRFASSGKGLYLLSDAASENADANTFPPARRIGGGTFEADAIAGKLFQAKVHGCYAGQQTLEFTNAVPSHPLLQKVRYLYEGTTVSHLSNTEQLDVIVSASDGSPLIAVPKSTKLNVVLDCGYSRYHPKCADDSVQLAINVTRFLTGNAMRSRTPDSIQRP